MRLYPDRDKPLRPWHLNYGAGEEDSNCHG